MTHDGYDHLRDDADASTILGALAFRPSMQGIPARDTRDEDRAQEARFGARAIRERAAYKQTLRDRARATVLRSMRGDY